jgi:hypothetical protein
MPPLLRRFTPPGLDEEARKRALADPGPSWRDWFYYEFAKVWTALGFFIVDALIIASFLQPLQLQFMLPILAAALYGEFYAFRYLWARLPAEKVTRSGRPFKRSWLTPFAYGRWTPEGERARAGLEPLDPSAAGPDPREFL